MEMGLVNKYLNLLSPGGNKKYFFSFFSTVIVNDKDSPKSIGVHAFMV